MIKTAIVDDEKMILDELRHLLSGMEDVELVGTYTQAERFLSDLPRIMPQLVLLDIEMPEISGLELARHISEIDKTISVVFVTAYLEYAADAYELDAKHYLLKPVRIEKLREAIDRVVDRRAKDEVFEILRSEKRKKERITIKTRGEAVLLSIGDILYVETNKGGSDIVTKTERIPTTDTIKQWEEKLSDDFFRCHRSFLVSLEHIQGLLHTGINRYELKLSGTKERIPVSREKVSQGRRFFDE